MCFEAFLAKASLAQYGEVIPKVRNALAELRQPHWKGVCRNGCASHVRYACASPKVHPARKASTVTMLHRAPSC